MAPAILYLPGAGGSADFWKPVAELVGGTYELLNWPGLGNEPPSPKISSIDHLVDLTLSRMSDRVDLVAQSMGGYVAIKAALAAPERVERLVLAVTSGGVPVGDLGGADWRGEYFSTYPEAGHWIGSRLEDLSSALGALTMPVLLIWGDNDPISPIAVGERLRDLLPDAELRIVRGGGHDLAQTHSNDVAAQIAAHLV